MNRLRRQGGIALLSCAAVLAGSAQAEDDYYDAHVHLTNYIQEGITAREYLKVVGDRVGRSVLFGIPRTQNQSSQAVAVCQVFGQVFE